MGRLIAAAALIKHSLNPGAILINSPYAHHPFLLVATASTGRVNTRAQSMSGIFAFPV